MEGKAYTPRENYERMKNGEDFNPGSDLNLAFAKRLLRRQAGQLSIEKCVRVITISDDEADPWSVSVTMKGGELSHDAQVILNAMRSNAHHTDMTENGDGAVSITFYYHRIGEE